MNARLHRFGEIYMKYCCDDMFFVGGFEAEELSPAGKTAVPSLNTKTFKNLHADGEKLLIGQLSRIEGKGEALFIAAAGNPSAKDHHVTRITFECEADRIIAANGETEEILTCGKEGRFSVNISSCQGALLRIEK